MKIRFRDIGVLSIELCKRNSTTDCFFDFQGPRSPQRHVRRSPPNVLVLPLLDDQPDRTKSHLQGLLWLSTFNTCAQSLFMIIHKFNHLQFYWLQRFSECSSFLIKNFNFEWHSTFKPFQASDDYVVEHPSNFKEVVFILLKRSSGSSVAKVG